MKNKLLKIAVAAATAFAVFAALGWHFFEFIVRVSRNKTIKKKMWNNLKRIKTNHPKDKYGEEYESGKEWCNAQKMEDFYISSEDGLLLHAKYLTSDNAKRIVILCHGYKGSSFGDFSYMARFLHENGCNLLFIDQRCCGESDGEYITFGAKEQYDVLGWTYYIAEMNKDKLPVYLYGESMGASTVIMTSGHRLPDEVKGIIADCGFCSMREQLRDIAANWFHFKRIGLLLFRVDIFCRLFGKFRMSDADTEKALGINKRPILFFHGDEDNYVEPRNSKYNYIRCNAPKEIVIIPGARHIGCPYTEPELYRAKVLGFFEKYDEAACVGR